MSTSSSNVSAIELVQSEIETTIQQAEASLTRFQENRDSSEDLQNCIDCLNQLRGIFVVVEVQGCVLLCQESVALGNEVPVGANEDKNGLLSNLSNAIFILRRYTEYFAHKKQDHPQLLLPIINQLRVARRAKPFPESHFFDFDSNATVQLEKYVASIGTSKLSDFEHHARRFRHMYQVGLLDLLKERNISISYRLLKRAAKGGVKLCSGEPLANFWALVAIVADVMHKQKMSVSDARKRMFMKVEKYLREMALVGKVVGGKTAPESLKKDLLYVLALSGDESPQTSEILSAFNVSALGISDQLLEAEGRRLFGPGVDVLRSLSKALKEEIIQLKDKLDILERGADPGDEDLSFIVTSLDRLSGTLTMLDLGKIAALSKKQIATVEAWRSQSKMVSEEELFGVADAILTIEQAIVKFEETGIQPNLDEATVVSHRHSNTYLSEARIVVVQESQAALVLAKRSITSYVESMGDKLHLANISQVMDGVRGAMLIIEHPRVAAIVASCMQCIDKELYKNESQTDERVLETLADALSSLEYYIESMTYSEVASEDLLKLSEESLASIGYQVN